MQSALDPSIPHYMPHLGERIFLIVVFYLGAWAIARAARIVSDAYFKRQDERIYQPDSTVIALNLKRRQTFVSLITAAVGYLAFTAATLVTISEMTGGLDRFVALAGAGLTVALLGFTATRFISDMIVGITMFIERWFAVGDTIIVLPHELQGVVEAVSLRSTALRTVTGERIHVHNSNINAVRVLPRGIKELSVELFVTDEEKGRALVEEVVALLPQGPTTFEEQPKLHSVEQFGNLTGIHVRCRVVPGREWLVEDWFCELLREGAKKGLIAHGPVVLAVDQAATRTYARRSQHTPRKRETAN